jgi:hypothetical protein
MKKKYERTKCQGLNRWCRVSDIHRGVAVDPMYLPDVENHPAVGPFAERIAAARAAGTPIPQIWHLFAFKPEMTELLAAFTQYAMRGPSPLSPGLRELIAAFTSRGNDCLF